jgi:hypothetical protein
MADLDLTVKLEYDDNNTEITVDLGTLEISVAGTNSLHHRQTVGTSEEAITLGDVAAGGYVLAVNRDATNYVKLRPGTGIADLIRIGPGECALFRLDDDATAPYAIADTGSCEVEFVLIDD